MVSQTKRNGATRKLLRAELDDLHAVLTLRAPGAPERHAYIFAVVTDVLHAEDGANFIMATANSGDVQREVVVRWSDMVRREANRLLDATVDAPRPKRAAKRA